MMAVVLESGVTVQLGKVEIARLKVLAGVVYAKARQQVLRGVLLILDDGKLYATATDLTVYARTEIATDCEHGRYTAVVDASVIKKMKGNSVNLVIGEGYTVWNGVKVANVGGYEDFPLMPMRANSLHAYSAFIQENYWDEFVNVAISASDSQVRPMLTHVCHRGNTMIATDGLRMMVYTHSMPVFSRDIMVPAYVGKHGQKLFKGRHYVYMAADTNWIEYGNSDTVIMVRQYDGTYPDVSRIIPTQTRTQLTITTGAIGIHEQAENVVKDRQYGECVLTVNADGVTLTANNKTNTSAYETPLDANVTGDDVTIAYNARYMVDALKQVGSGAVIGFNGAVQPFTLVSGDRLALVSPVGKR